MTHKNEKQGFVKGALLGGIVAGIGALLFAPKSGKETRDDIASKVKKTADAVGEELHTAQANLDKKISVVKDTVKDLKGDAANDAKALIKKTEALRDDVKVAAANISETTKDVKAEVLDNAKMLVKSSSQVLSELEVLTKKTTANAKSKAKSVK